jgi:hypothetical protein
LLKKKVKMLFLEHFCLKKNKTTLKNILKTLKKNK